jgi:hypothetical protein
VSLADIISDKRGDLMWPLLPDAFFILLLEFTCAPALEFVPAFAEAAKPFVACSTWLPETPSDVPPTSLIPTRKATIQI